MSGVIHPFRKAFWGLCSVSFLSRIESGEREAGGAFALYLTQPDYRKERLDNLLMSRNEVYLVWTALWLQNRIEGWERTKIEYRDLLLYLQTHFKGEELRVCVLPYAMYDIAVGCYWEGNEREALLLCSQAVGGLEKEKWTFCGFHMKKDMMFIMKIRW